MWFHGQLELGFTAAECIILQIQEPYVGRYSFLPFPVLQFVFTIPTNTYVVSLGIRALTSTVMTVFVSRCITPFSKEYT
jgi:hypothetical protein